MLGQILKNVRVIELSAVLAGPSVGQFLAELGAEVIKVENRREGGDVTRRWVAQNEEVNDEISAYFSAANSGKKSIALDLAEEKDRLILYKLIEKSDIVLSSFKKGAAGRLQVDDKTLRKYNSKIIHGAINGYGRFDERVGYDAIIQAESGFMYLNRQAGVQPQKMPVALIDILAAHHLKEAILASYIHKLQSGKGSFVSVSLMDAAIASLANQATQLVLANQAPEPLGNEHPNIVPYGLVITTQDHVDLLLAVGSDHQFTKLCRFLDRDDLSSDIRFRDNQSRVKHREDLNDILRQASRNHLSHDFLRYCRDENIPVGEIKKIEQALDEKQSQKSVIFDGRKAVGLRQFAVEVNDLKKVPHIAPPPALDQHRKEILRILDDEST